MRKVCYANNTNNTNNTSLENDCVIKYEHYSYIYRISFLCFFTSIYALHSECYELAAVPGGVFLTSVNYWRRPTYGWRRNLDMGYVICAVIYQNYRAYYMTSSMVWWYYFFMFLGVVCYPVGVYLHKKNDLLGSTYVHCLLHLAANVANVLLYSGGCNSVGVGVGVGVGDWNPPFGSTAPFCPCSDAPFFR